MLYWILLYRIQCGRETPNVGGVSTEVSFFFTKSLNRDLCSAEVTSHPVSFFSLLCHALVIVLPSWPKARPYPPVISTSKVAEGGNDTSLLVKHNWEISLNPIIQNLILRINLLFSMAWCPDRTLGFYCYGRRRSQYCGKQAAFATHRGICLRWSINI